MRSLCFLLVLLSCFTAQILLAATPTKPNFTRTVQARIYKNTRWMLAHKDPQESAAILASLNPTHINGLLYFDPWQELTESGLQAWQTVRETVRAQNSNATFDISLNLSLYKTSEAVRKHMQFLAEKIPAEAWFFEGIDMASNELLQAALEQAKEQQRFVGGSLQTSTIPAGVDYLALYLGHGEQALEKSIKALRSKNKSIPILLYWSDISRPRISSGTWFVRSLTPADRRKMLTSYAQKQKEWGATVTYPVFAPEFGPESSYDATRDEFMMDTLQRLLHRYNSLKK